MKRPMMKRNTMMRHRMKRRIMLAAALAVLLMAFRSPAIKAAATDQEQILQLERDWTHSFVSMDIAANERILADDFIGTEPAGRRVKKSDILAELKTGEPLESAHLNEDDVTIRFFGETAVVNGSSTWQRKSDAKNGHYMMGRYIWTDVFVKRKGKWQVVASQDLEVKNKP